MLQISYFFHFNTQSFPGNTNSTVFNSPDPSADIRLRNFSVSIRHFHEHGAVYGIFTIDIKCFSILIDYDDWKIWRCHPVCRLPGFFLNSAALFEKMKMIGHTGIAQAASHYRRWEDRTGFLRRRYNHLFSGKCSCVHFLCWLHGKPHQSIEFSIALSWLFDVFSGHLSRIKIWPQSL